MNSSYETVVGLEIHAELKTRTKMFCSCSNDPFGAAEPNIYICPVCLGLPGTLPVMNRRAVEWTVLVGLALGCEIGWPRQKTEDRRQKTEDRVHLPLSDFRYLTKWDRKNYFYPDLPKGYQISQYDLPICHKGKLAISDQTRLPARQGSAIRPIEITRIHLEEDTGKLVHPIGANYSLIDYNRAGVPLMELVTEPVIRSGEEAAAFANEYQLVLRTLGISDADMEKGQMRVEANISVRPKQRSENRDQRLGTKVEVKNLNSIKSVRQAIAYEAERQIEVLESGGQLVQETRGWDETKQRTFTQRVKETAADYRYFPEPDLPPVTFSDAEKLAVSSKQLAAEQGIDIQTLRQQLLEMPWVKRERYETDLGLARADATRLVADIDRSRYFDGCVDLFPRYQLPATSYAELARLIVNWILNEFQNVTGEWLTNDRPEGSVNQTDLVTLAKMLMRGEITGKIAKGLLAKLRTSNKSLSGILKEENVTVVRDAGAIQQLVKEVIDVHPQAVADYQAGMGPALGFLIGQVMAKSRGQAEPNLVRETLQQLLSKEGDV